MKENEPLRKKVARQIASPLMLTGIGIGSVIGGMTDAAINKHNIDNKIEQAFPRPASPEELEQAKKEILVFDENVHNLIANGKPTIDIAEIANQPQLTQSIKLVKEEQIREEQRDEFRRDLDTFSTRSFFVMFGGIIIVEFGGLAWAIKRRREQRERRSQNFSP